ncbi:hypothetical protein IV203_020773 [Nitzschia inconspicua]|uniref:Uncharacterized protein n=1 Tax=Nitzschia inconspicua TaxID=303405 RepID=A0A9K3KFJ9_9STRA|nr:hypothetical protein IV203_020773 [Nitzschia inconspicua]
MLGPIATQKHKITTNDNTIGSLVPIYGIASPDLGCSCEHHAICGSLVHIDMLVRFKKMVVYSENNNYKTIMAAVWVTEEANRCVIGHVPEKLSEYFHRLEGRIAQVSTIYHHSKDSNKMAFSNKNDGGNHPQWNKQLVVQMPPILLSSKQRRIFNASITAEGIVGLEKGTKPVAPQPGDYFYSGMHDQGPLPDLKQGGPMALLLGCVEGAKEYNNSFLTTLIEVEKEQKTKLTKSTMSSKTHSISSADSGGPSTKKSKTQKDSDGG